MLGGGNLADETSKFAGSSLGKKIFRIGAIGVAPVMTAAYMWQGYQGDLTEHSGMRGLADAAVLESATASAVARFAIDRIPTTIGGVASQTIKSRGILSMLKIGLGANIAAGIGMNVAGFPGAYVGGYIGGALMRNGWATLGVAAVAGGATLVGYGTYSLLKTGYRKRVMTRRIDTDGDTSSFMTQNAMTMRARAVLAMRNSHLNARSALGQESTFLHMNRNYFSTYRQ
jgi:hypothetical protein